MQPVTFRKMHLISSHYAKRPKVNRKLTYACLTGKIESELLLIIIIVPNFKSVITVKLLTVKSRDPKQL